MKSRVCIGMAVGVVVLTGPRLQAQGTTYYVNGTCGDDVWTGTDANCAAGGRPLRNAGGHSRETEPDAVHGRHAGTAATYLRRHRERIDK